MKKDNFEQNKDEDILESRLIALELLSAVLDRKQALDNTIESHKGFNALSSRDRAFVRMMVTTSIRRLGQIDDLIRKAQERPDSQNNSSVLNILRLGVAQIFFMVVPDHASVDTSVRLAEKLGFERQKGFVNAVMRKFSREGNKWVKAQDPARLNTPEWLLKVWIADYGLRTAAEIATANLNEAPLDLWIKNPADKNYFGNVLKATELSTGTLRRLMGGNIRDMEGFEDGRWWVQDASAALAAQIMDIKAGEHIIDMCAAPGGKTLQMAAMGANVTAIDRSATRMKRLEENIKRMDLSHKVKMEIYDAGVWKPKSAVTKILLDAPCSATGTIRRHPDLPYLKSQNDISNLMIIQEKLLDHAAEILSKNGILVYCTCSLQKDECERQIENFLIKHTDFKRIPILPDEVGGYCELIDENGDIRILPTHLAEQGGMDGFFISRLGKI